MNKQKIRAILPIITMIISVIGMIYFGTNIAEDRNMYEDMYEKAHLTAEDLKISSSYKYSTATMPNVEEAVAPEAVSYKKLYGVEYIGKYTIAEDEGIEVSLLHGDPAKILILDKEDHERFYAEVSELNFEPGKTGKYDVYSVGNKFTGRVQIKTYKCE